MWKSPEDWEALVYAAKGAAFNLVLLAIWAVWAVRSLGRVHLNLGR